KPGQDGVMATSKNNNVHSKGSGKKVGRNTSVQGFSERLRAAAHVIGLRLSDVQIDKLLTYLEQMDMWNRVYNLTAIRDPEQMLIQHIFDSLAVVPIVSAELDTKPVPQAKIVDVGSGAGL